MLDFEMIQRVTDTADDDMGLILENQDVVITGRNGRPSVRKYTIYRARFQGRALIGNIHRKNDSKQPWPEYEFISKTRQWVQREVSRKRDRDANRPEASPRQLKECFATGEQLTKAEMLQLFESYPEGSLEQFACAVLLARRFNVFFDNINVDKHFQCPKCRHTCAPYRPERILKTGRVRCTECLEDVKPRIVSPVKESKEERIHRAEQREANWDNLKKKGG